MTDNNTFSYSVIENTTITMRDGTKLAAQIWLPDEATKEPVPAILEYIPYRKRDHKLVRDTQNHGFFACHGYAGVRVDLRGSGDSEGVLQDEYLEQELQDGEEVLRWIAAQSWCSGKVGMFGLSWGGFNGLQLAARQPPELAAVISVCSSDNRYTDDVHYMGGCLLTDNLSWASTMFGFNSCPPDPLVVGDKWRDMWLNRLNHSGLWLKHWLSHQHRDEYWKHGSVCEDYDAIKVPVLAVSGWADGYTNTVFHLLQNLSSPCKGLVGPWGHRYPHQGGQQTIDFLGQCVKWWDHWLKGKDTGADKGPRLTAWMQHSSSPLTPETQGHWVNEPGWPTSSVKNKTFGLSAGRLCEPGEAPSNEPALSIISPLTVGLFAGKWCSYSETSDQPWDQREDDGGSLTFDSPPLEEDLDILGQITVELSLSVDKPVAMVAVRLTDITPDDRATRVTYGVLNLTHRDSHETPSALEPGQTYQVQVPMNYIAQRFVKGHRIRLAISTSYWPLAWPAPKPARLTIHPGQCRLQLPRRGPVPPENDRIDLGQGHAEPPPATTLLRPAERDWEVRHNMATNKVSLEVTNNDALIRLNELDLIIGRNVQEKFSFYYDYRRHNTLRAEATHERIFERDQWRIYTKTRTILTATPEHFLVSATLDAYEGEARVFSKTWNEQIPRNLV